VRFPLATHRVPRARKGEADVDRVLLMCVTGQEMEVGPLEPSCRRWLETTAYCAGQEPGWEAMRKRRAVSASGVDQEDERERTTAEVSKVADGIRTEG
jgi:hypothetical protein